MMAAVAFAAGALLGAALTEADEIRRALLSALLLGVLFGAVLAVWL